MTAVTVMGAAGMLGAMVFDYLGEAGFAVSGTARGPSKDDRVRPLDVTTADDARLEEAIGPARWVVNCVGAIKQRIDEDDPRSTAWAVDVNAVFPHRLARVTEATGVRVIQIATDCVFSGSRGGYVESDVHDATDVYGKTKSLGEVRSDAFSHLRCSIVGPETVDPVSLLGWFLSQSRGARVEGFTNHLWNGITTLHFAKLCEGIINDELDLPRLTHVVPADAVTKFELLNSFGRHFARDDVEIAEVSSGESIDRTLATEHRLANASLWASAGSTTAPSVDEMIEELGSYVLSRDRFRPSR